MKVAPPRDLVRPRAILFDWDNTLVDSWTTIHEALNLCMAAMGKPPWSLAETKARVRLSLRESFPLHFGARWEEASDIYLDRFRAIHLERLSAVAGPRRVAAAGSPARASFSASSATRPALCCAARPSTSAGRAISARSSAPATPWPTSPTRAPVRLALAPSGIAAGEAVWFVGDTGVDMECAGNSGCVPVLLGGEPASEELRVCAPRLRLPNPRRCFTLSGACDLPWRAHLRTGSPAASPGAARFGVSRANSAPKSEWGTTHVCGEIAKCSGRVSQPRP